MIFLSFLVAIVAAANAQIRPTDSRTTPERSAVRPAHAPHHPKTNTVIENRNVNIIVNVDPKDVANELYKLIQNRLDTKTNRRTNDANETKKELEKIVAPVVNPTRRSLCPTPFEVAYQLDHLTRSALLGDRLATSTMDDEIAVRHLVAKMLTKLQSTTATETMVKKGPPNFRRMQTPRETKDDESDENDDDRFVNVNLRILKSELLQLSGKSLDADS